MDKVYSQNNIKPDDPHFVYDKRITFKQADDIEESWEWLTTIIIHTYLKKSTGNLRGFNSTLDWGQFALLMTVLRGEIVSKFYSLPAAKRLWGTIFSFTSEVDAALNCTFLLNILGV